MIDIEEETDRREEKAKVVASVWRTEFIQFHSAPGSTEEEEKDE